MPVFQYTGIGSAGREVKGIKDADSAKALRTMLRREGIFLKEFREAKAGKAGMPGFEAHQKRCRKIAPRCLPGTPAPTAAADL